MNHRLVTFTLPCSQTQIISSGPETNLTGDFGAALVVGGSGNPIEALSLVVVHKAPEVPQPFSH